jgi:hypothetical protein
MPYTPVPEPTPAELEVVAEIVMLSTSDATTMVKSPETQAITNAKWARTLTDITTWAGLADEANDIKRVGSIEFFENNIGISRLAFRNKIRQRYGYVLLISETGAEAFQVASGTWF